MRFQLRNVTILIGAFVFTPFLWILLFSESDLTENTFLEREVAELRERLHFAESVVQERENDVHVLRRHVKLLLDTNAGGNVSDQGNMVLPAEARDILVNLSQGIGEDIRPPGMHSYLPHLLTKPNGLRPAFKLSRGRVGVSIVMGVPTIKREKGSYLMETLSSLISNLNTEEKDDCVIIVFVAEPNDITYVKEVATTVESSFKEFLDSGLLEVVAPSADYYPSFDNLKETFGDPIERVRWRTKQNLDFSYLMMYARSKGTYYVQLEDDLLTRPNYLSTMRSFAALQVVNEWVILEFSKLGFIGKLFKSRDLSMVVEFFLMFHRDKPIDWLLDHLLYVKVCNPEKDRKHCQQSIAELRRRYKPSLFQHVGTHSSLKGKVQKLKDKDFGRAAARVRAHINPNAQVSTTLKVYQHFSLDRAYMGETFFWGLIPKEGDTLNFYFHPPIYIDQYIFRSGNAEHPGDRFFNTTVEVLPADHINKENGILSNQVHQHPFNRTSDGFLIINQFRMDSGTASGSVLSDLGPIDTMRLRVLTQSLNWIILSDISILEKQKR